MKNIHIKQKLANLGIDYTQLVLGDYDFIGEFTAKRTRSREDANYQKVGAFYRANYERGILIYNLITQFKCSSMLEIGFGRGYATFCAAKAFYDMGIDGKIVTVDPHLDEKFIKNLSNVFPNQFFDSIQFQKGTSASVLPKLDEKFDLIYIDGDHSFEGTKIDWELTKEKFNKFMLFDDYHLPTKKDSGSIQCNVLIDLIDEKVEECLEKELIIMDRRIFIDDRGLSDDQVDYGQVLLTKNSVVKDENDW